MTRTDQTPGNDADREFEALLRQTPPRPAPPDGRVELARSQLKAEWHSLARQRRRRSRLLAAAAAIAVVAIAAVGVNLLNAPAEVPVRVATIDASDGSVYFVGDESTTTSVGTFVDVFSGQTIMTAGDAVVGLAWTSGGSLRIDGASRVRFVSVAEIELLTGRVYVDSNDGGQLDISTRHGRVTHIGTRYMTRVDGESLVVSVRGGRVRVDGVYHDADVDGGSQLTIRGRTRPATLSIRTWGPEWQWIEAAAPDFDADGKSAYAFLLWVSRETGLTLKFADGDVEQIAREEVFHGRISDEPRIALRQRMAAVDLDYDIDDSGVLTIYDGSL